MLSLALAVRGLRFVAPRFHSTGKFSRGKPLKPTAASLARAPTAAAPAGAPSGSDNGRGLEGDVCLSLSGVSKTLPGGRVLLSRVSLAFNRGAKIGVLGLNGAGKSTLLKILAGVETDYDGSVWRADGLRVGYLAQEPTLDESKSVHENIMDGLRAPMALLARFDAISEAMGQEGADIDALLAEQADVQATIEAGDLWNLAHVVAGAKAALRVPHDDANVPTLSGGEKRRVALCRLLLEKPSVLLLDEPTNHLDATSVAWLERFLAEYRGTVLAVTHDRYFLDNVAGWILEVDRGSTFPYAGNYSVWLEKKAERLASEERGASKRAKAMALELEWIRQGPRARQAKSKARIARYEASVAAVETEKAATRYVGGALVIPPGPRLGDVVLNVDGLTKVLGDRVLFKDVTFSLPRGGIVGIIGANGAGKTTLLRAIIGDEECAPDSGSVRFGDTVRVGLVSQSRAELDPGVRVLEAVCGNVDTVSYGDFEMPARQYLAAFNLVGEQATKLVRALSGGERNRVHLARVLRTGVNLLMLDEPTNDLDVDTLRALEEALSEWDGCAVVVSHDRYFLDRVCTHMLVFHAKGRVQWFEGSYSDYVASIATLGARAVEMGYYVLPGSGAASDAAATTFKRGTL